MIILWIIIGYLYRNDGKSEIKLYEHLQDSDEINIATIKE